MNFARTPTSPDLQHCEAGHCCAIAQDHLRLTQRGVWQSTGAPFFGQQKFGNLTNKHGDLTNKFGSFTNRKIRTRSCLFNLQGVIDQQK